MPRRIVNLDDLNNSIEIILNKKSFVISRITLEARSKYGEYLQFCGTYLENINKMQNISENETQENLTKYDEAVKELVSNYAHEKVVFIDALLKIILEANEYEYTREWWEASTDYAGMEKFIVTALKKDEDEKPQKKEMAS